MTSAMAVVAVVVLAAQALALTQIWVRRTRAPSGERGPLWRIVAMTGLGVLAGVSLWLTLFPPDAGPRVGRLVVATRDAPREIAAGLGEIVVALPEAGAIRGAERAPDLATALRRHPAAASLEIVGQGLEARDRGAWSGPIAFTPPSIGTGLVSLDPIPPLTLGDRFVVTGRLGAVRAGDRLELVSPGGEVVDRVLIDGDADFVLSDIARAAGVVLYRLRIMTSDASVRQEIDVPVQVMANSPVRLLVLAGAPGPEVRFLRRWAEQTGAEVSIDLALGAGARIGSSPARLSAASLDGSDVLIIDERRWAGLSEGERRSIRSAVAGGLGLILRPTGAVDDATRRDWANYGFAIDQSDANEAVEIAAPSAVASGDAPTAQLTRRVVDLSGGDVVPVLKGSDGQTLIGWRAYGRGRVGVWAVQDSFALVLQGQDKQHASLWAEMSSMVARRGPPTPVTIEDAGRVGRRIVVCGLNGDATVRSVDDEQRLVVDPRAGQAGCAAVWPAAAGWSVIESDGDELGAFYTRPTPDAPELAAHQVRQATIALAARGAAQPRDGTEGGRPGSPWPWFALLSFCLAALWWLERRGLSERSPQ